MLNFFALNNINLQYNHLFLKHHHRLLLHPHLFLLPHHHHLLLFPHHHQDPQPPAFRKETLSAAIRVFILARNPGLAVGWTVSRSGGDQLVLGTTFLMSLWPLRIEGIWWPTEPSFFLTEPSFFLTNHFYLIKPLQTTIYFK